MSLSNIMGGGIIMVALIISFMSMPKLLDSTLLLQDAASSVSEIEDDISSTLVSVNTLVAPTTNPNEVTFSLDNTGEEKLWDYENFNVIITYDGPSSQYTQALSYAGTCSGQPATGKWCINSITDDILDPDILNYDERLNVRSSVTNNISTGSVIVIVGTDNGVTSTLSATIP